MRKTLTIIAMVISLGTLGSAGLAIAHELPGQGCEHAAEGKNKHCGEHVHGTSAGADERDPDGDGVPTTTSVPLDNCPGAYNPLQGDLDGDGIGNVCDHFLDMDEDGVCDAPDAALCGEPDTRIDDDADDPKYANDTDGDGFGDEDEDALGAED